MAEDQVKTPKQPARGRGPMGHGPMGGRGPVEKAKNFKPTFNRLLKLLRPYIIGLIAVLLFAVIGQVISTRSPKVLGEATTEIYRVVVARMMGDVSAAINFDSIQKVIYTLLFMYVISSVFQYLQQYVMAKISQQVVLNLRKDIDYKLTKLPLKYYDSHSKGDILSRTTNDVDNISGTLQQSLTQIISSVVQLITIIYYMWTISITLMLISLVVLPVSMLLVSSIAKKSQVYFVKQWAETGTLNGVVEETYTAHNVVKAFGKEDEKIAEFSATNNELYNSAWKAQFISGIIMPIMNFVNNINYVFICVIGGKSVIDGTMEIGNVQAFIAYSKQFGQPISQVANIANVLQSTVASAERVFELLDEEEEIPDVIESNVAESANGFVVFNEVDFSYLPDKELIKNMNLIVTPGQTVAIVGPTGAGKTTIVNLLMRFYEIDNGNIIVDGTDIRDMSRVDLRKTFGMVLQDTWLFNGTVKENIAYGKEGATFDEVVEAAKAARVHHFITTLPDGYDTVLNEDASNISAGQKQLLTIARALLADPRILILDEATSSVDTRTEVLIQKAMTTLMNGRTSFVIAHRLSTIKDADLILVMNQGSIIEMGSHNELLEQKGFYSDLYNSQFSNGTFQEEMD